MITFLIAVIGIGWAFSWYFGTPIILYIAVGFALVMNVVSYWYSHKLVVKMTRAKEMPDTGEYQEVHNIVENLAITAGLPKPQVYVIEDAAPNAFATGRNPEHAVVAVTTGLLERLNKTELEGVLAHEMSHIGNRDMLLSTIAVVLVGFLAILSDIALRMMLFGGGDNERGGLVALAGIALAIFAPIAGKLMQMAVSRKREFLADASGALLTRYPEGLASALEKISKAEQPVEHANAAVAHLFIANPFGGKRGRGFMKLFMTHPPVEERIQALRSQKG